MLNTINIFLKWSVFIGVSAVFLSGCQSQSAKKNTVTSTPERPLYVIRSQDGIQDLRWKIVEIRQQSARFFHQEPYLQMSSNSQRVNGSTGCNSLFGSYKINTQHAQLSFDAKANHQSCDNALAQEAELIDALVQTKRYQLSGNRMLLQNAQGQTVVTLQK